ncbi:MAG: TIM barrel protein [Cyclobacteriaceae bacterium]|nr:TIM barrel protein [Cyclobacteriaceae bacterium]
MKRRDFLAKGAAVGAVATTTPGLAYSSEKAEKPFQMKYAPHFGMFKNSAGEDLEDQIQFMYDHGFRAMEDNNLPRRSVEDQKRIGKKLEKLGMEMGVFVIRIPNGANMTDTDKEAREGFLKNTREAVEIAKRVNARWMTVVPRKLNLSQEMGYQTVTVMDTLKYACEILEPHNLTMVLEPLNFFNHPGFFLTKASQAYELCKAVGSPSCKMLFDIYHHQIQEGNLIPNIDQSWEEIAYIQTGDNPGRKEPGTGEINYKNVFKHIRDKGYKGILGMEHGNFHPGKEGEEKLIKAYREVDDF